jgi:hypothetical protein
MEELKKQLIQYMRAELMIYGSMAMLYFAALLLTLEIPLLDYTGMSLVVICTISIVVFTIRKLILTWRIAFIK